jgi:hypothetical protein
MPPKHQLFDLPRARSFCTDVNTIAVKVTEANTTSMSSHGEGGSSLGAGVWVGSAGVNVWDWADSKVALPRTSDVVRRNKASLQIMPCFTSYSYYVKNFLTLTVEHHRSAVRTVSKKKHLKRS